LAAIDSSIDATHADEKSYETQTGITYRTGIENDIYAQAQCRLDLYYPKSATDFSTVVWFHGGGLTKGERAIPDRLKNQGFAVVGAGYRLHPQVTAPVYIEDAAAAVAWTVKNIERHGGSPRKIFVAGHSAGAYLAMMIGFDKQWLHKHDIHADDLAGLIPLSGQAITHFTIRSEKGIGDKQPVIDRFAPLFHVRKDAPPILLITGDRNRELLGRYEENAYLWRMLKEAGHRDLELLELQGYDHGGMAEPAYPLLARFVQQRSKLAE
jgi:acetyl esterase/lipase